MSKRFSPLVSIVIPVYNVKDYLNVCLESLINQTYDNWEAILVDDGSHDSSGEICDAFAAKDSRFKVIHKENGGQALARNMAIRLANGEYIFFLDSDDFLANDALERLTELAVGYGADMVQCDYIKGSDKVFPDISPKKDIVLYDHQSVFTGYAANVIVWGKLMRKSIVDKVRFPEGLRNEDDYTTWKFYYKAQRIVITSEKLYYYTCNPHSTMAGLQREPDLKYFDAYAERVNFFKNKKDLQLEIVSRVQWLKCIVIQRANKNLSEDQLKLLHSAFVDNYSAILKSKIRVPLKLRLIFAAYTKIPRTVSYMVNKIR